MTLEMTSARYLFHPNKVGNWAYLRITDDMPGDFRSAMRCVLCCSI